MLYKSLLCLSILSIVLSPAPKTVNLLCLNKTVCWSGLFNQCLFANYINNFNKYTDFFLFFAYTYSSLNFAVGIEAVCLCKSQKSTRRAEKKIWDSTSFVTSITQLTANLWFSITSSFITVTADLTTLSFWGLKKKKKSLLFQLNLHSRWAVVHPGSLEYKALCNLNNF